MNTLKEIFNRIYFKNVWRSQETRSGNGSTLEFTKQLREALPIMLKGTTGTRRILDAGCGDWNWMQTLDLGDIQVLACDVVPEMINTNIIKFSNKGLVPPIFFCADITTDPLPEVDTVMCRATLFHLSFKNVKSAAENFRMTGAKYILTTHHPHQETNEDIEDGSWRRLNFTKPPFNLKEPAMWIMDGEGDDGYLALWKMEDFSW
jgi:SAM-dependent methyltransferase